MKRFRLTAIFHAPDSVTDEHYADKLVAHMNTFTDPHRSRNAERPHYETCEIAIEHSRWDVIETNTTDKPQPSNQRVKHHG